MTKDLKPWVNMTKNIAAFIIGFWALGLIPVYGLPFGGCNNVYLLLDPHCSVWPEFIRSFLFVVVVCFVSASAKMIPLTAMMFVCFVSIFGGFERASSGI